MKLSCSSTLTLFDWVNTRSKCSQKRDIRRQDSRLPSSSERTLHRSSTHFHALDTLLIGWVVLYWNQWWRKSLGDATMQAKKTLIQSRSFMEGRISRVGCNDGDKWSCELTYFSFWDGLLWPASELNCALFPESKGKPKVKDIERAERVRKEKAGEQTHQCAYSIQAEDLREYSFKIQHREETKTNYQNKKQFRLLNSKCSSVHLKTKFRNMTKRCIFGPCC